MLFDFDGYLEFLAKILLDFYYTVFFSHVYRSFFSEFTDRTIISDIFDRKSNGIAFFRRSIAGRYRRVKLVKRRMRGEKGEGSVIVMRKQGLCRWL